MLDLFAVFTKGGIVLWSYRGLNPVVGSPMNSLVRYVLEQRAGGNNSMVDGVHTLQWTFVNELNLVFVVAYQKILQLAYINELLEAVKAMFVETYSDLVKSNNYMHPSYSAFESKFNRTLTELEQRSKDQAKQPKAMKRFEDTKKFQKTAQASNAPSSEKKPAKESAPAVAAKSGGESTDEDKENDQTASQEQLEENIRKMSLKFAKKKNSRAGEKPSEEPKRKGKESRKWTGSYSAKDAAELDFSKKDAANVPEDSNKGLEFVVKDAKREEGDVEALEYESEEEEIEDTKTTTASKTGGMFSFFKGLASGKEITKENLAPILEKTKEALVTKNVAAEIADNLCASLEESLIGEKVGTFTGEAQQPGPCPFRRGGPSRE
eukprot:Colp12_sorted_trinity150504_noHs@15877